MSSVRQSDGIKLGDTVTDANGQFRIAGLASGAYRVSAFAGTASTSVDVPVGPGTPSSVDLLLKQRIGLKVRLFDVESRLPLASASFRVVMASGQAFEMSDLFGDERGTITVPVDDGQVATMVIKATGYAFKTLRGHFEPNEVPLQIGLTPGGRSFWTKTEGNRPCSFELIGSDGSPIAMTLIQNPGPVPMFATHAFFTEIEPGTYRVVGHSCGGQTALSTVTLVPGQNPVVTLVFR